MHVITMATDLPHEVATKCLPIQRNLENKTATRGKTQCEEPRNTKKTESVLLYRVLQPLEAQNDCG